MPSMHGRIFVYCLQWSGAQSPSGFLLLCVCVFASMLVRGCGLGLSVCLVLPHRSPFGFLSACHLFGPELNEVCFCLLSWACLETSDTKSGRCRSSFFFALFALFFEPQLRGPSRTAIAALPARCHPPSWALAAAGAPGRFGENIHWPEVCLLAPFGDMRGPP